MSIGISIFTFKKKVPENSNTVLNLPQETYFAEICQMKLAEKPQSAHILHIFKSTRVLSHTTQTSIKHKH